jgi:putative phosphotransacetylase
VELSITDATMLGVKAPVRDSGDLRERAASAADSERGESRSKKGVIVAQRHIP